VQAGWCGWGWCGATPRSPSHLACRAQAQPLPSPSPPPPPPRFPVCSVSDVVWSPHDGQYLVTACDDDSRPVVRVSGRRQVRRAVCTPHPALIVVQLWDLRSSTSQPLCEYAGHKKGVLSVDWCPHDPNLLVSTGKDAHTFVWDIQRGVAVAEVSVGKLGKLGEGGGVWAWWTQ